MTNILSDAFAVRRKAEAGPVGKRKSSFELYAILADCLALAERCIADPAEFEMMRRAVRQQPSACGGRRYIERQSDAYQVVCRFIWHDMRSSRAEGSNACRYAACLREAAKHGRTSDDLAGHLQSNGGINALFMRRPLNGTSVSTRCLHLSGPITITKGVPFTLHLVRRSDNIYEVLEVAS